MEKSIRSPRYKVFLALLKKKRLESGIVQKDMAKILKTNQGGYSKFETGEIRVDIVQLESLCKTMGISLTEFVTEFETSSRKKSKKSK